MGGERQKDEEFMRLVRFTRNGGTRNGRLEGDAVVDLSHLPDVGASMRALLEQLPARRSELEAARGARRALPLERGQAGGADQRSSEIPGYWHKLQGPR
ncbi:Rv2993c-like domain-containing protein [Phenylobacterium montanum]|uniref:DUF2437 domain-containing protein n=1 Tax=Phenylobacterium montanum TaxID=2823693 RepID=A0A975G484_9CAUL|nr:DUF2437 domain-containing protein [Caulobacter sp. S6]